MDSLIGKITGMVLNQPIRGDDIVDRLHYFVTVALLLLFAFGTGLQEYVGSPIDCWTPLVFPQGSDPYHLHINSYCWAHQLSFPKYQRDNIQNLTKSAGCNVDKETQSDKFDTAFYRWVTLILIVQACLFKIPSFLWQQGSSSSGADLEKIRDLVVQAQTAEDDNTRKLKMDQVVAFFEKWITGYRSYRLKLFSKHSNKVLSVLFCFGKRSGHFLSSMYLSMKILNLLNVIGNIFLMAVFLDVNFWRYGLDVLDGIFSKGDWQDSCNFPRLLICDFILEGGDVATPQNNTPLEIKIQCSMTLNLLLEKILVLEWFWLVFILIISIVNLVTWWIKIKSTALFCRSYPNNLACSASMELGLGTIEAGLRSPKTSKCSQTQFVDDYLRSDGVLVLRLLELNANRDVVGDVVGHLWHRYQAMHHKAAILTLESVNGSKGKKSDILDDGDKDESQVIAGSLL